MFIRYRRNGARLSPARLHLENATYGVTLIELLIGLSILSILTAAAAPGLQHWRAKVQADNVARQIADQIRATRELAIHHGEPLSLCGSNHTHRCALGNIQHLQIFSDRNNNRQRDNDEAIIAHSELEHGGHVRLNAHGIMTMEPNGRTSTPASYIYCPDNAAQNRELIRKVTVSFTGRTYIASQDKVIAASASLCPEN
ncbi:MAG TPA: GspH/FimT family pseudopilin [Marinagarivorans sp.]